MYKRQLLNIISENAIKNHVTVVTFLDLSKAFDCLQYDKPFFKLDKLGFSKHTLTWFKSYLSNRTQVVDLNGTISHQLDMNLGVPQGSILGPILFLLYVNDINNCDTNAKFVKFADDTTVITSAPTLQEASWKMNLSMDKVYRWFQSNKLNLNPSKTRYMIFNCKGNSDTNHIHINGENIERVWRQGQEKSFKLVGIMIDEKLNWEDHINYIAKKISYANYSLNRARNR